MYICIYVYIYEGTDLTGKLSKHVYAPDPGPNVPN